jgi:aspartyl protease family protein
VKRLAAGVVVKLLAACLFLSTLPAAAGTTVMVLSLTRDQVELLVNGAVVRRLYRGQSTPEGIVVHDIAGDSAIVEVDGRRWQMKLGSSTASSVVLQADARGHFVAEILVNGVALRALVDTGASAVAMNASDARRIGVDLGGAQPIVVQTAGGPRRGLRVRLASVQVGDIVLRNVEATISESNELPIVLLGMSFLSQVDLQRTGSTLTLVRRH